MLFPIKALVQFATVAEERSFTRAAERLHVAQPWLSQRVRRLEELAGVRLLERSPRSVVLTADGSAFLEQAKRIIAESIRLSELAAGLSKGQSRPLRLGAAPYTYYLPERSGLLEAFSSTFPEVQVEVDNDQDPKLRQAVLRGELEAAFVTGLPPEGCEAIRVRQGPLRLLVPDEHPLARHSPIEIDAVAGVTVAAWRRGANPVAWDATVGRLKAAGASIVTLPEPFRRAEVDRARQERMILAVLGEIPGYDADETSLSRVAFTDPALAADLFLVRRTGAPMSKVLERFWCFAAQRLGHSSSG